MWMRLSSGREELVLNEDHVKRLLGEGAVEIDDPRVPQEPETPKGPEQPQGSSGEATAGAEQTQESTEPGSEESGADTEQLQALGSDDKSAQQTGKPAQGAKKTQ